MGLRGREKTGVRRREAEGKQGRRREAEGEKGKGDGIRGEGYGIIHADVADSRSPTPVAVQIECASTFKSQGSDSFRYLSFDLLSSIFYLLSSIFYLLSSDS